MRIRILVPVLLLLIVTSACAMLPGGEPAAPASSDSSSTALFSDDFSASNTGWDSATDEAGVTDYLEGEYQILVNQTDYYLWANPGKTFSDVRVEVDLRAVEDRGGDMGLICRYKDAENFYFLRITSDGYYGISKMVNGEESLLGNDQLIVSDRIKTGTEANHLRADCVGDQLTLYVNGDMVADITDADLTSGDVGLIAGTFEQGGNDVRFDNFQVFRP